MVSCQYHHFHLRRHAVLFNQAEEEDVDIVTDEDDLVASVYLTSLSVEWAECLQCHKCCVLGQDVEFYQNGLSYFWEDFLMEIFF